MAKRNQLSLDFQIFERYAEEIDKLGGNLKLVVNDAMQQAGETVAADTLDAVNASNLPAKGIYSRGATAASVIKESEIRVEWSGLIAEVGLGFDKTKPGAGGFLISGTPRMKPDYALEDIYARKKYQKQLIKDVFEIFMDAVDNLIN